MNKPENSANIEILQEHHESLFEFIAFLGFIIKVDSHCPNEQHPQGAEHDHYINLKICMK